MPYLTFERSDGADEIGSLAALACRVTVISCAAATRNPRLLAGLPSSPPDRTPQPNRLDRLEAS